MIPRAVRYFMIVLLTLSSLQCVRYSVEKVLKEEPALMTEAISSVVLLDGSEVVFADGKARYEAVPEVAGRTEGGDSVRILAVNIKELRIARMLSVTPGELHGRTISEIVTSSQTLLRYDKNGGRVDTTRRLIRGSNSQGTVTSLPVELVHEYRVGDPQLLDPALLTQRRDVRIAEIISNKGNAVLTFDGGGGRVIGFRESIQGETASGSRVAVPVDSVLFARTRRADGLKTLLATFGGITAGVAVVGLIAAATKQSCPFIYSYTGKGYEFDGEPLGGATAEGLARSDLSRLEHIVSVHDRYRILVRNEVAETQYIDGMSLVTVDHDRGQTPIVDQSGAMHLYRNPVSLSSARDEKGTNLLPFFTAKDGIAWQTHLEHVSQMPMTETRHTLTLTFAKPPRARRACLIVHAGTSLWGSQVIRSMHELRGANVDHWYREADAHGPEFFRVMRFLEREDMYSLRMYIRKGDAWAQRGAIIGGGPYLYESQLIPISVSGVAGTTLTIRMNPPYGFWSIDYFGVTYDADTLAEVQEVPPLTATTDSGIDISHTISIDDRQYYAMPTTSDQAIVEFAASPVPTGLTRSVFVRTKGYYLLHLRQDHPEDRVTTELLWNTPGAVVRYAIAEYAKWYAALRERVKAGLVESKAHDDQSHRDL